MNKKALKSVLAAIIAGTFLFASNACETKKTGENTSETAMEDHEGHDHSASASEASEVSVPDYSNVSEEAKNQIKEVYQSYISLKNELVESSGESAKKASQELKQKAEKVNLESIEGEAKTFIAEQVSSVKSHAEKMAGAADIDSQRAHLEELSKSLFSLIKSTGANAETVYYQYCPMANEDKGGYWLSEKKEINNPYFGESMLKCGENKETLSHKM